ncbi:CAP domain-containing protein [Streptomyces sp. NBC_01498]|uniref:CAP domain-containing protein n=1 Tax=Streptomyces sp. NBC_01498 TaxID=2975870 RepID=UPI002E7AE86E|nr:CAP domain-containing protein [Streptomyces sp. NBC_01498]WTL25719.1 CAP domain-containing protein [Streptomyces sp. NBC_01498]
MLDLVPGGNLTLPDAAGPLALRVPGPFDLSVLITGDGGQVSGDGDFVFYNQPSAPGATLRGDTVTLDMGRLRAGASRVTVVVSPADPAVPLGRLPVPALSVTGSAGRSLARFTPPRPTHETVLLLAEVYRRGGGWKLRALGQGYADGLAGIARDFGIAVTEDDDPFTALVNAERARSGAPPVTPDPALTAAAEAHCAGMAARGSLGPAPGTSLYQRITDRGHRYLTVAEHLVSGPRTEADFLTYCLGDPRTAATVRDPALTRVGLAHAPAPGGDIFWTAVWTRPLTPDGLTAVTAEVLARTNAERRAAGLRPLSPDPHLTTAAQSHSDAMVTRGFYSHTSPEGRQPWDRARSAGSGHRAVGENIACGQRSAAEVVQGWMNSPGHRANILTPGFTHLGVGLRDGGELALYWTQLFGGSG